MKNSASDIFPVLDVRQLQRFRHRITVIIVWQNFTLMAQNTSSNTFTEWQRLKALKTSCFLYSNSGMTKKYTVWWRRIPGNLEALSCELYHTSIETLLELLFRFPCQVYSRFKIWHLSRCLTEAVSQNYFYCEIYRHNRWDIIVTTFGMQCSLTLRASCSRQV